MAIRIIDDTKLQNIAVAIQARDDGTTMTVEQMPTRIASLPFAPDPDGALLLVDWEGTPLRSYTYSQALALTSLPLTSGIAHDLLTFQGWNWTLADIKTWMRNNPTNQLTVGAIYISSDGQDHDYWRNPNLQSTSNIYMQKRGTISDLGDNAFNACNALSKINLPNGIENIGNFAFRQCRSLPSINIPAGVTTLGNSVFSSCASLSRVSLPNSIRAIGENLFYECFALKSVVLPEGITAIPNGAFNTCRALFSVAIPNGVTSIGNYAFNACNSLVEMRIPDGVTSIGDYAVRLCSSLTTVDIPDSVESIGANAFNSDSELYYTVIRGKPALSNTNAFSGIPSVGKIYVHRADLSWYEAATNWSSLYAQGKIVAAADYLQQLDGAGIDVTDFENEVVA